MRASPLNTLMSVSEIQWAGLYIQGGLEKTELRRRKRGACQPS